MLIQQLRKAALEGLIRHIDHQFAQFVVERLLQNSKSLNQETEDLLVATAALVSEQTGLKHICIHLNDYQNKPLTLNAYKFDFTFPPLDAWIQALKPFNFIQVANNDAPVNAPLVLEFGRNETRLYTARYYAYEQQIADSLNGIAQTDKNVNSKELKRLSEILFGNQAVTDPTDESEVDWQMTSAVNALFNRLSVITGGPGTGKTTTVTKLLTLLLSQNKDPNFQIKLAAPTGKAAVRLTESIRGAKQRLQEFVATVEHSNEETLLAESIARLPDTASTLHRLLKTVPNSIRFRHNQNNPLLADLLVIDEVSMIDQPTMAKLLEALGPDTRLILLGDKDQLASVEAGSVLGDICSGIDNNQQYLPYALEHQNRLSQVTGVNIAPFCKHLNAPLSSALGHLRKSYRFGGDIKTIAIACNQGQVEEVESFLTKRPFPQDSAVEYLALYAPGYNHAKSINTLLQICEQKYAPYIEDIQKLKILSGDSFDQQIREILKKFDRFRLLCALKQGLLGAYTLNDAISQKVKNKFKVSIATDFYPGRPVMITENNYDSGLFNGDIGLTLPCEHDPSQMRVYFLTPDNHLRKLLPSRLPAHETAFAMTIHKSQGSEFDHIALAMPEEITERSKQILSRELLYTGITRAKEKVTIVGTMEVIKQSTACHTFRRSGLAEKLWG